MGQKGFYFSADDCVGCKTCVAACKDINHLQPGTVYRKVYEYHSGSWKKVTEDGMEFDVPDISIYFVSDSCNHCGAPQCMPVCPTGAITKRDDGIVFLDSSLCEGDTCLLCVEACPYGEPVFRKDLGKVAKCNYCSDADYRTESTKNVPACVTACLNRALHYGELEDLQKKYGTTNADISPLASSTETFPSIVIEPNAANPDKGNGRIANPTELGGEVVNQT